MPIFYIVSILSFLGVCLLTCMIILAQESKSSGMGAAFGGESASAVLGSSSADILKKITAAFVAGFFLLSLILSVWTGSFSRNPIQASPEKVSESTES